MFAYSYILIYFCVYHEQGKVRYRINGKIACESVNYTLKA